MIETGLDDVDYTHTINAPVEIWESLDGIGKVVAIEVIGRDEAKTILVLKS